MDSNPWLHIPLEDYERHMSHHLVGQSTLLNSLTKKYLDEIKPETVIFLGIAGGNGLEHIDNNMAKKVYGIDINPSYLETAFKRFNHRIPSLQLLNLDITMHSESLCRSDFIWAGLIFEYTGIDDGLMFCKNNLQKDGHLIVSIQSNNNIPSVSPTGIESVKKAGEIFSIVDPEELQRVAADKGYKLMGKEENILPNGKSIITFHFLATGEVQ
ncbi:MAG TPA: class I SAM-dependent methyltransferase [Puia sp.]|nr:class I SAM-dependent methyltransferase [Puia sp.]